MSMIKTKDGTQIYCKDSSKRLVVTSSHVVVATFGLVEKVRNEAAVYRAVRFTFATAVLVLYPSNIVSAIIRTALGV